MLLPTSAMPGQRVSSSLVPTQAGTLRWNIYDSSRHTTHSVDVANTKVGSPLWQIKLSLGLSGKTLGLIGLGRLGSQTARFVISYRPHDQLALTIKILNCESEGYWMVTQHYR
jgi:hypothetical protein